MVGNTSLSPSLILFARHRDGRRLPVFVSVSPMTDATGTVIGGIEVFRTAEREYQELQLAMSVQRQFLPQTASFQDRLKLAYHYAPAELIGGDFIHLFPGRDRVVAGLIGDVSGHGLASALVTGCIRSGVTSLEGRVDTPAEILYHLADTFGRIGFDLHYCTAQAFTYDPDQQLFLLSNAGHPPPMLVTVDARGPARGTPVEVIGDAVGMLPDPEFINHPVRLDGGRLYFYSDGLPEAQSPHGDRFGEERWFELLTDSCDWAFDETPQKLVHRILDFVSLPESQDDLSVLIVEQAPSSPRPR